MTFFGGGIKGLTGGGQKDGPGGGGGERWDKSLADAAEGGLKLPGEILKETTQGVTDLLGGLLGGGKRSDAADRGGLDRSGRGDWDGLLPDGDDGPQRGGTGGAGSNGRPEGGRPAGDGPGRAGTTGQGGQGMAAAPPGAHAAGSNAAGVHGTGGLPGGPLAGSGTAWPTVPGAALPQGAAGGAERPATNAGPGRDLAGTAPPGTELHGATAVPAARTGEAVAGQPGLPAPGPLGQMVGAVSSTLQGATQGVGQVLQNLVGSVGGAAPAAGLPQGAVRTVTEGGMAGPMLPGTSPALPGTVLAATGSAGTAVRAVTEGIPAGTTSSPGLPGAARAMTDGAGNTRSVIEALPGGALPTAGAAVQGIAQTATETVGTVVRALAEAVPAPATGPALQSAARAATDAAGTLARPATEAVPAAVPGASAPQAPTMAVAGGAAEPVPAAVQGSAGRAVAEAGPVPTVARAAEVVASAAAVPAAERAAAVVAEMAPRATDAAGMARLEALGSPAAELLRAGAPREVASAADAALRDLQLALTPEGAAALARLTGTEAPSRQATEAARQEVRSVLGPPAELPPGAAAALLVAAGQPAPLEAGAALPPGSAGAVTLPREPSLGIAMPPLTVALPGGGDAGAVVLGGGLEAVSVPPAVALRIDPAITPEAAAFWTRHAAPAAEAVQRYVSGGDAAPVLPASFTPAADPGAALGMTLSFAPGPAGWAVAGAAVGSAATPGLRGGEGPTAPPLTAGAPPAPGAGGATLHLSEGADPRREAMAGAYVSVTAPVPVPIDLVPAPGAAPLPEDTPRLWREDDTAALIAVGPAGPAAAIEEGMALLARLREGRAARLSDLAPGQGIATWQGSPVHLLLAGIARTGKEGVALSESAPPRIEVIRGVGDEAGWTVLRDGTTARAAAAAAEEELRLVLAYGLGAPAGPHGSGPGAARAREAIAAALLAMESARQGEGAGRRRQAWAGLAGDWVAELVRQERHGPPPGAIASPAGLAMLAGLHGPLAAWDAMMAAGAAPAPLLRAAPPPLRSQLALTLASGAALSLASVLGQSWGEAAEAEDGPKGLDAAREGFATAAAAALRGEGGLDTAARALGDWGAAAIRAAHVTRLSRGDGLAIAARLGRFEVVG